MPLPMVHLAIAREISNYYPSLKKCPEFYLGAVSPDAIHMRENSTSEDKFITHLGANGEISVTRVLDYLKCNFDKSYNNFLLGYGIHVLTDIIWNETVYSNFRISYNRDSSPISDIKKAYYNDTDWIDFKLYREADWRPEVWSLLEKAGNYDVENILNSEEINRWKLRTLHWFDNFTDEFNLSARYIKNEVIIEFINTAEQRIRALLEGEGLI